MTGSRESVRTADADGRQAASLPLRDPTLDQVQRWMHAVIVDPDGIEAGMTSEPAQLQIPTTPDRLEDIINRSHSLTSSERLQVYANAYYARLVECLREEFPALVHALGEDIFDAFAFGYLQQYPSQSYTLADLSRHFPDFLSATRPGSGPEDAASPGDSWPNFLIDVATVERTYSEVFSGPGVEGQRTLQPEDVQALSPDEFESARLIPVPCLRLLRLSYPVHDYISAVRHNTEAIVPDAEPTWLVITRREYVVRRSAVSELEYELLAALQSGETIGTAIDRIASRPDVSMESLESSLHDWFRHWSTARFFSGIEL